MNELILELENNDLELQVEANVYKGENGATFTPSVSTAGVISWTNDKSLPNPSPVNIRGPQGDTGPAGADGHDGDTGPAGADGATFTPTVSSAGVISWTNDGGKENPPSVNIKGPQGATGPDGTTFTPSVSSAGVISWTNDGGKTNPPSVNIKGPQGDTGPAGVGVPSGGTIGQILKKHSATDYDTEWSDDSRLPSVSSPTDDGKVLRVVSGVWTAVQLPSASGVSF